MTIGLTLAGFEQAVDALTKVQLLMEGTDIKADLNSKKGTITFELDIAIHIKEDVFRVTEGPTLLCSTPKATTAIIVAVSTMIAAKTREVLKVALL